MRNMADRVARARELHNQITDNGLVASIPFVIMAQSGQIDDVTATEHAEMFPPWGAQGAYQVGDIRRYEANGKLYRCLQAHAGQADWSPDKAVSLWVAIGDPAEEWPQYSKPVGAPDAYMKGAKVTYNGKHYISLLDNNVWTPDEYPAGWEKVA